MSIPTSLIPRSRRQFRYFMLALIAMLMIFFSQQKARDRKQGISFLRGFFDHGRTGNTNELFDRPGYLVWNPNCQIPRRSAFHHSILSLLKRVNPFICSDKQPLTYVALGNAAVQGNYFLHINKTAIPSYIKHDGQSVSCCYSNVTRFDNPPGQQCDENVDNRYNVSSCEDFGMKVELKPEEEFILVRCKSIKGKERDTIYTNMHGVVPIKKEVKRKIKRRKYPDDDSWLNILLISYDSISQLNLIRTMPKTVAYLKEAGFVNLHGHNKIGQYTFQNIMAILTGHNESLIESRCWRSPTDIFDRCPFVWKDFKSHGYVTAYIEDSLKTAFNFHRGGFEVSPTDHYFRPYVLAAEKHLSKKRFIDQYICYGPEPTSDHVLKYLLRFVTTYKNYFFFAIAWLNNFSHDDVNAPQTMDLRTVQLLNDLNGTEIFNNTLVMFMSDHGIMYGDIRKTLQGWFEERLPFIYFLFPEWYRKKYSNFYQSLLTNRRRLTSHYDIYVTLRHLLRIAQNSTLDRSDMALACPKCKSLFSGDVGDRTCGDAGISPEWCACKFRYKECPTNDSDVIDAAKYVTVEVRKKLKESHYADHCAELYVKNVVKAKMKLPAKGKKKFDHKDYLIIFQTEPGNALFECTVRHYNEKKFSVIGSVSRINSYGNQSHCVSDEELKLYCFCVSRYESKEKV